MKIGEQIAFFRKQRGYTQAELGRLVGVSSQAVSKWESGGSPDVEMLPEVAAALGVSIDVLFGREGERQESVTQTMARWLDALPQEQRLNRMYQLLTTTFGCLYGSGAFDPSAWEKDINEKRMKESCFMMEGEETTWVRSAVENDGGLALGVNGWNFPMYLLLPEPEGGYGANFAPTEDYRKLFAALAQPGALELLLCLMERKNSLYSAGALRKFAKVSAEESEKALADLVSCGILRKREIETEEGTLEAYTLSDSRGMVPLLYLARWVMDGSDFWTNGMFSRKIPILREGKHE